MGKNSHRSPDTTLGTLLHEAIDAKALQQAIEDCQAYQRLEDRGYVDALHARYPPLRRYLPAFYTLPFVGEPGTASLQTGLQLVTQLDTGVRHTLRKRPRQTLSLRRGGRPCGSPMARSIVGRGS